MSSVATIRRSHWQEPRNGGVESGDYDHEWPLYPYDFVHRCAIGTIHLRHPAGKAPGAPTSAASTTTPHGADPRQPVFAPGNCTLPCQLGGAHRARAELTARNQSAPGNYAAPGRPPPGNRE